MPITFACPCGSTLKVGDEHGGRRVRCPVCRGLSDAPAAAAPVPPPPRPLAARVPTAAGAGDPDAGDVYGLTSEADLPDRPSPRRDEVARPRWRREEDDEGDERRTRRRQRSRRAAADRDVMLRRVFAIVGGVVLLLLGGFFVCVLNPADGYRSRRWFITGVCLILCGGGWIFHALTSDYDGVRRGRYD